MRVLAVGDIHTKLWIIDKVRQIADNYDAVVFCGDYADDWGKTHIDTLNTWKELRSLSHSNPNVKLVQGNHDYIYTHHTGTLQSGYNNFTQTEIDLPENRGLRDWLHNLPIVLEVDKVLYSHAGVTENWSGGLDTNSLWNELSPLWVRPGDGHKYQNRPQVFGHTPSKTCWEVQPGVWCIDTFSTYPDGTPFGDHTALEVVDGKEFKSIKLE